MKYALGNMLNGAGGLNADQLALDLQFAADKTLTARRGPTPVLTRGSTGTFVGSNGLIQTAAVNAARFDHDPVTLASRGLLIEEGRTNSLQRSEDFTQTIWTKTNVTVTGDNATSPDGNSTADSIFETAINSGHRIQYGSSIGAGTYSASVYVKSIGGRSVNLEFVSGGAGAYANFNLQTATVALSGVYGTVFTLIGASITSLANNWFRVSLVATSTSAFQTLIQLLDGTNNSYLGDVTKGVQLWGAQLEAGFFATSYIPTTTSALARSADVCSITGANFTGMWNATEGSLFASASFNAPTNSGVAQMMVDINDTTTANRLRTFRGTTGVMALFQISGSTSNVEINQSTGIPPFTLQKTSAGFRVNDYVFYVNNTLVGTDTTGAFIVSPTTMNIGEASAGSAIRQYTNGHIAAIRYYKKRLPNAKLVSLTT